MNRAHRTASAPPAERHPERPREYDRDVQPVAYFNDAVFAIAMTLLVVSIRVPSGTSAHTLGRACAASVPHSRATEPASS